jgi:hypothetical protein
MTLENKHRTWFTALVLAIAMALPGVAYGQDKDSAEDTAADTAEETTEESKSADEVASVLSTIPILGSGLDMTITRDDKGEIASVSLDPSNGATPTKEGDHKVVFLMEDGDTEVIVKSTKGIVQTKVKADAPEDVSGDGAWSGDVFGNGTVTVPYSVAFDGITPSISVGAISAPGDVTAEIGEGKVKTSDDGDRSFYAVKVELGSGDQTAVLGLVAKAKVNDEGETKLEVSATLFSKDRVRCWFGEGRRGEFADRDRDDRKDDDGDRWDRDHDRDQARGDRDRWDGDDDSDRWDRNDDRDRWDDDDDHDRRDDDDSEGWDRNDD